MANAPAGASLGALSEGDMVWLAGWDPDEKVREAQAAESGRNRHKPIKYSDLPVDAEEPPRIAAIVSSAMDGRAVVEPIYGWYCDKCRSLPEHSKIAHPDSIEVTDENELRIYPMQPSNREGRQDMVDLEDLQVGELMHNLRIRYVNHDDRGMMYYTYVGDILVVANPMEDLGFVDEAHMRMYKDKKLGDPMMPPHIFAIGDEAFRSMLTHKKNESIVISGESGAGKSESTKHVLKYLAFASEGADEDGADINKKIIATSEVLEAYGNAKTSRNHNSSRFGKFVEIQFDDKGAIVGAKIEQYLLEQSRIVDQETRERNYHIFYLMLTYLPPDQKAALHLTEVTDFTYCINKRGTNADNWMLRPDMVTPLKDEKRWDGFNKYLGHLGIDASYQNEVYRLMAAVLHMGEVQFESSGKSDGSSRVVNPDRVAIISELMGCDNDELTHALLYYRITDDTNGAHDPVKARDNIDALAKGLYGSFFRYFVEDTVNDLIRDKSGRLWRWIGVLDIFGFESFQAPPLPDGYVETANKFEQLCINVTNEQLQNFFYAQLIPKQEAIYKSEGVEVDGIYYADNGPALDLIMHGKRSLFGLLDSTTRTAERNVDWKEHPIEADKDWLKNMKRTYKEAEDQRHRPGARKDQPHHFMGFLSKDFNHNREDLDFWVYHYAGEVFYTVQGAVDRNKAKLSVDLEELLTKSSPFIQAMVAGNTGDSAKSVASNFRAQLDSLQSQLVETEPFFVRCVKPNCAMKKGGYLEDHKVLDQLVCAGMYAVIQMRQNGYPVERGFEQFVEDFLELEDDLAMLRSKGDSREQAKWLLSEVERKYPEESQNKDNMRPWQAGHTRLFMKDNFYKVVVGALAQAREQKRARQLAAIGHLVAIWRVHKEMTAWPERVEAYQKLAKRNARIQAYMDQGMSRADAIAKVDAEDEAERVRIEEEFKAVHLGPVVAIYDQVSSLLPQVNASIEELKTAYTGDIEHFRTMENKLAADVQTFHSTAEPDDEEPDFRSEIPRPYDESRLQGLATRRQELAAAKEELDSVVAAFKADYRSPALEAQANEVTARIQALVQREQQEVAANRKERGGAAAAFEEEVKAERAKIANASQVRETRRIEMAKERERLRLEEEARQAAERKANKIRKIKAKIQAEQERRAKEKADKRAADERHRQEILELKKSRDIEIRTQRALERKREREEKARKKREEARAERKRQRENQRKEAKTNAMFGVEARFQNMIVAIRYVGELPYEGSGEFVGIECPVPVHNGNDGVVLGVRLFECRQGYGLFVRSNMLEMINNDIYTIDDGDMVWIKGTFKSGVVRYVGPTHFESGEWVGIELEQEGQGRSNGTVLGKKYFECDENQAIFVRPHTVVHIKPWSDEEVDTITKDYMFANHLGSESSGSEDEDPHDLAMRFLMEEADEDGDNVELHGPINLFDDEDEEF